MLVKFKEWYKKTRERVGFQMIEILIIVAVVALLAAVVGPSVLGKGTEVQDKAFKGLDGALKDMVNEADEG